MRSFEATKSCFKGLWLYDSDYSWEPYPIIRLDFSRHQIRSASDLELRIKHYLKLIARQYQITLEEGPFDIQVEDLILQLSAEKRVVILIDEYDKPIIDNIDDRAEAKRIRDTLRGFYTTLKSMDEYIRFIFITGISKFSKVGVFSTMNHLDDLTLDPRFATLLGITDDELNEYFQSHIHTLAQQEGGSDAALLQKIRDWYDGFCFVGGGKSVYNPYSTIQLFIKKYFANYWFETGTPTFLIDLLKERKYPLDEIEGLRLQELSFSTFDIEDLAIVPLLFQTGYLTIKAYDSATQSYTLGHPNAEVRGAFLAYLLGSFSQRERSLNDEYLWRLINALEQKDLAQFFAILDVFFANVPYNIHLKHEKYYQTIFFLIFKLLGLRIDAEVHTNRGRIDTVIELPDHIFIFEFKIDSSADDALQQIKKTEYAKKYQLKGKAMTMVGANFDSKQRKITEWQDEDGQQV